MFFLFAILPLVSSATPIQTTIQASDTWQIRTEFIEAHAQSIDHEFIAHIYNASNGVPIYSGASCYFHLYNAHGTHLVEMIDTTPAHTFDYEFDVDGGNFSTTGTYSFLIHCNSTTQGGFIAETFEVTPNGQIADEGKAIFYIGLLAVLMFFLALSIFGFVEFDNILARVGLFGLSYLLLIAVTFVGWNMASDFLTSSPFLISMLRIAFFVLIVGVFPLVIGGFAYYIHMLFKIKEIERLMGKGFSYDDAERRTGGKFK